MSYCVVRNAYVVVSIKYPVFSSQYRREILRCAQNDSEYNVCKENSKTILKRITMMECGLMRDLRIEKGGLSDYKQLAFYHYRDEAIGPYCAVFRLQPTGLLAKRMKKKIAGVIVYRMPTYALQMRRIALGGWLDGLDKESKIALLSKNIRTISRVIIEPRFRGLGLAVRLVRETMAMVDVPIIEALAVMGQANPFFEKAGLTAYNAPLPARSVQLIEAFELVGINERILTDAKVVQNKIDGLSSNKRNFLEREIREFLKCFPRARDMQPGIERTRYILGRLTERPVYYIKVKREGLRVKGSA